MDKKSKTQKSGMTDLINLQRSDGDYWSRSCPIEWDERHIIDTE